MFTMLRRSCGAEHGVWEGIVVINTTEELRIPTQYVNGNCNLNSYVEQVVCALLWIVLSNCLFQGWPNNKVRNYNTE